MRHLNTVHCKHHRSQYHNDTCEAGVEFAKFHDLKWEDRPCCCPADKAVGTHPLCELSAYPTKEEQEAEEREVAALFARTDNARKAIVDHLGGPWKRGMPGSAGSIPCPICTTGTLRFSRAGLNGHIHAGCTTEDCVAWME